MDLHLTRSTAEAVVVAVLHEWDPTEYPELHHNLARLIVDRLEALEVVA